MKCERARIELSAWEMENEKLRDQCNVTTW